MTVTDAPRGTHDEAAEPAGRRVAGGRRSSNGAPRSAAQATQGRSTSTRVIEHLAEIAGGRCSVDDAMIEAEPAPEVQEILVGLLMLFETLSYNEAVRKGLMRELEQSRADERQARLKAERAATTQARFLANMSHEIRTPLNGVLGMLELLQASPVTDEQRVSLGIAQRSGEHLLAVLNDILDLSKLDANQLNFKRERVDLHQLVRDVCEQFAPRAASRSVEVRAALPDTLPRWWTGDSLRVRQVLANLVANATKFTEQGSVTVSVRGVEGGDGPWARGLRVEVQDTGPGVAPALHGVLFDRFTQADASMTRKHGGTGLGLAISRELARGMGGELSLAGGSTSGACFVLELPMDVAPDELVEVAAPPESLPTRPPLRRFAVRALLVEDNLVNQLVAKQMLELLGCAVDVAADGRQGLERVSQGAYDVVFMDCQMPHMDGFVCTERIRAAGYRQLPVVALTALHGDEDAGRCRAAGMDEHLAKPVSVVDFQRVLRALVPHLERAAPSPER